MLNEHDVSNSSDWMESGAVDISGLRSAYSYSIPHTTGEVHAHVSPVIAASVEEKVADLVRSYPHLEAFLKSHARDTDTRIRDLAISDKERDQLLFQIIAARRQQAANSGTMSGSRFSSHGPRRKRLAQ